MTIKKCPTFSYILTNTLILSFGGDDTCMLNILFNIRYYYYYRCMVHFLIGLDFLFITFSLHFFLSWTSSLSISSSAISASTLSNHVFLGLPTSLLPSTLNSIHFFTQSLISFPHHMPMPSQSTTSNDSCDRLTPI